MAVKFIQKNKDGDWTVSNSKSGKVIQKAATQKEAIRIAGSTKTTQGIMIKRSNEWVMANGWDSAIAAEAASEKNQENKTATKPKKRVIISDDKKSSVKGSPTKPERGINGLWGMLIGISIIGLVIGLAFMLGALL